MREYANVDIIIAIISSGLLNCILSYVLYSRQLRKKIKAKGNESIAKKIQDTLLEYRQLELQLKTQEIYKVEEVFSEKKEKVDFINGEAVYPAIMNDWNAFNDYREKIAYFWSNNDQYLSCRLALNLVFIDRYLMQLSMFVSEHGGENSLDRWGTIFIIDLRKWQKRIDQLLVKEINKNTYKLESHESLKWRILRKTELVKQYESTILYYLTHKTSKRYSKQMEDVDELVKNMFKGKSPNNDEQLS